MIFSTKEEWDEFERIATEHYDKLIREEIDADIIKKIKEVVLTGQSKSDRILIMKDKLTVYLCGPMTGIPEGNYPEFDKVRDKALAAGFDVVSPVDLNRDDGIEFFDPSRSADTIDKNELYYIVKRDLNAVMECDGIILLEGWTESKGARTEYHLAKWLGKTFYNVYDFSVMENA